MPKGAALSSMVQTRSYPRRTPSRAAKHIPPEQPTLYAKSSERIGDHLSTWRRIEGITARELAERAGVSVDTIRRLEHGDPSVGLGKVLAVSRVVGILSQVEESFDPASTERGRLRLQESVPKRVRRS